MVSALNTSHGLQEDFKLVSEIHPRQRLRSASSTDVVVPPTRRCTWRPRISGRSSSDMERVASRCHLAPSLSSFLRLLKTFLFQPQLR